MIDELVHLWSREPLLNGCFPHKLHRLYHIPNLEISHGYSVGTFSETEFEIIHADYQYTYEINEPSARKPQKIAMEKWNGLRFELPEIPKSKIKEPARKKRAIEYSEKESDWETDSD